MNTLQKITIIISFVLNHSLSGHNIGLIPPFFSSFNSLSLNRSTTPFFDDCVHHSHPSKKKKKKGWKSQSMPFWPLPIVFLNKTVHRGSQLHILYQTLEEGDIWHRPVLYHSEKLWNSFYIFHRVFLFGWFREVMFYCPSGNFWLGFGTEGSHCLAVKDCQWDSQKDSLFLCVVLTLTLSIFQTVLWIFPMSSSSHWTQVGCGIKFANRSYLGFDFFTT